VAWFEDGPTAMPDRVIDVVADRIGRQRQRRTWRLLGRPFMNTYAKLGLAAAAAVVVALVGWQLLPRQGVGPVAPTASPTAAPSPTSAPTAVGIRDVPTAGGHLDAGQWRFHLVGVTTPLVATRRFHLVGVTTPLVATIPAGWGALEGDRGLEHSLATNSGPSGVAILFESPSHGLFSDPCHWNVDGSANGEQPGDVTVGPAVADLVAALRANAAYTTSAATPVTFGSAAGQQLELRIPAALDPATCDVETGATEGQFRVFPDTIYAQGQGNIWQVSVVDVAGTRVVVILEYFPGTAPDRVTDAKAIVDSFEFTQ
jgi:hypothetical protein